VAGLELAMPARESLGWFTQAGDREAAAGFLLEVEAQRFVVSLDMLCFGGLVASRRPDTGLADALARLESLRELRRRRPEAQVYGFSVITRLGKTVTSPSDLEEHLLLRAYSVLLDRMQRLGDDGAEAELARVRERLGREPLEAYLEVRRRNHAVNRAAVELAAEEVLDYLVLAQEDAAPEGIHIPEQLALRDQMEEFRLGSRATVISGADEMGMLLLARQAAAAAGGGVRMSVDYASAAGAEVVPDFETRPLRETVEGQVAIAGGDLATPLEADAILFVHTPVDRQGDIAEAPPPGQSPRLALQADSVAERVEAASAAGRVVGLADAAYCNGADPEMVAALRRTKVLGALRGYAGWNTTANTTGTVIGQLTLGTAGGPPGERGGARQRHLAGRLADDYGYQSVVRPRAMERARLAGANPYALGEAWEDLEGFVSAELEPIAHELYSEVAGEDESPWVGISLPWRRLFEVEVSFGSGEEPKNRS
jgi:hypothetical protein